MIVFSASNDWDIVTHFLRRLFAFPALKILAGIFIWTAQQLFGETFRVCYGVIAVLYLLDTVTGVAYAWRNPAVRVESRRLFHGLVKLCIYGILLAVGHQCSQLALLSFFQGVIESLIVLTEMVSILENIQKIADLSGTRLPIIGALLQLIWGKIAGIENQKSGDRSQDSE